MVKSTSFEHGTLKDIFIGNLTYSSALQQFLGDFQSEEHLDE